MALVYFIYDFGGTVFMAKNENFLNGKFDEYNYKDIFGVLVQVFGQGNFQTKENSEVLCTFTLSNNSLYFRFIKVNPVFCRLEVLNEENIVIYWENINTTSHLYERLNSIYRDGIFWHGQNVNFNRVSNVNIDDFDDDFIDPELVSPPVESKMFEPQDDDEETESSGETKFFDEIGKAQKSVVPEISQIRVVSLKLDGEIVAYRFKTDAGAFDMRRSVALIYGLGGFKTERFINLESVNGLLLSKSEIKNHQIVPDVSECEEDCRKLIDALFQG